MIPFNVEFPAQRVSGAEKQKADWYGNSIDYIIAAGLNFNNRSEAERKLDILHGNIPNEFYKKTLNPYNASKEKYQRFPATLRNFDIMSDIIRRYVSEYYKGVHEFIVSAVSANVALKRNAKLRQEVGVLAMQVFQQEFMQKINQKLQELQEQGIDVQQINPEEIQQEVSQEMPDMEKFVEDFNEKYTDDESKQAQDVLDYIKSVTSDDFIYLTAFFNYVALGECYTYTEVKGTKIIKEAVPVIEAYPIPNNKFFIEDHDMFARKIMMSYEQIIDSFDDYLSDKDREFLKKYYSNNTASSTKTKFLYSQYFEYYPDVCEKFNKEERELFQKEPVSSYDENTNLFEVWHVVWRGEAKKGIVTYINEIGLQATKIVDENYVLNPELGDINIEWNYEQQIYEGYRIGNRYNAIYPIKARPILFQRDGKLPYNGIMEVLPMMGKFSIIKLITPYQIMRNIIIYHREMVIAKNKMLLLLLPQSLIASDEEDKIYKMAADGLLLVDDEDDANTTKMQQVRMLNANMGDYITQLTNLIEAIKMSAREIVDMNMQRYGEIAQSAGAATTQEAVARSSMGSVIIMQVFDMMRAQDYTRDLDFAKFAYIDGLDTSFLDSTRTKRYISLDVNSYIYSDYGVFIKNNAKELDKLNQLKQWAFSAAQNGDLEMAVAAITGENVAQIKSLINKFSEIKMQHENEMKQADQMLEQAKLQTELQKIQAKGEEDRKTLAVEYQYKQELANAEIDVNGLLNADANNQLNARKQQLAESTAASKKQIDEDKLAMERQKMQVDMFNKAADRQVKREQMENQLKIAKQNKNKYDK